MYLKISISLNAGAGFRASHPPTGDDKNKNFNINLSYGNKRQKI